MSSPVSTQNIGFGRWDGGRRDREEDARLGALEEFVDGDDLVTAGAAAPGPESPAEAIALGAALLAEVAGLAILTLVDDVLAGGLGQAWRGELVFELPMSVTPSEGDHAVAMGAVGGARGGERFSADGTGASALRIGGSRHRSVTERGMCMHGCGVLRRAGEGELGSGGLLEALQSSVFVGVVGDALLPAVPDDEEPCAGKDADGVRMVVTSVDGPLVKVGGPGVGASGVGGEVTDGIAELFVGGPAEADRAMFARLSSAGGNAGETGQRLRSRESGAAVADLGEQTCGANGAGTGQAGEDVGVGVEGELLGDLCLEGIDLFAHRAESSQEGTCDVRLSSTLGSTKASGSFGETYEEGGGRRSAAVADAAQPNGESLGGEPVCSLLAVEALEEAQADGAVDVSEQADRSGEHALEVCSQLIGECDPMRDQVFARPTGSSQGDGGWGIGDERAQSSTIGAKHVSEDEGVEAVVLVAGGPIAGAQVLELVGADDEDGQVGGEKSIDNRAVRTLDGDLLSGRLGQPTDEVAKACGGVSDGEALLHPAIGIDDGDGVIVSSPVDARRAAAAVDHGQSGRGRMLHISLLAAGPSGEAPSLWCQDAAAMSLTVRRSEALSPVDGLRVRGNRRASQNSCRTSKRRASGAMARRHLGGIGSISDLAADIHRVHQ